MRRGCDGADIFARSIITMLAQHRLENSLNAFRIFIVAAEVPVDTQPVHIMEAGNLVLAYYRDIVFYMTCHYARLTPNTGIQINRHAPLDSWLIVNGI